MKQSKKAAIVLGGGIKIVQSIKGKSSYEPENQVKTRLDKALDLFHQSKVDLIITTGNYSKRVGIDPAVNGPKSEAEVGRKYLIKHFKQNENISAEQFADRILIEDKSFDTIGNAWFSKQDCLILNKIEECIVITSDYHLERSKLCFDWVLGADYKIEYIGLESALKNNKDRAKVENLFNKFMLEQLVNSIPAGDDMLIEKFIQTEHLAYCMSKRSEAMFNACMETASITAGYENT